MILKISIEKLNVNMYTNDLRLGFQKKRNILYHLKYTGRIQNYISLLNGSDLRNYSDVEYSIPISI